MAVMRFKVRITLLLILSYMIGCLMLGRSILFQAINPSNYFQLELAHGFNSVEVYRTLQEVNSSSFIGWQDIKPEVINKTLPDVNISHNYTAENVQLFKTWASSPKMFCDGRFSVYNSIFVELHDVMINRSCAYAKAMGGEDPLKVVNRPAEEEDYTLSKGIFTVKCSEKAPNISFKKDSAYLAKWHSSTVYSPVNPLLGGQTLFRFPGFTVALARVEYANVYWTVIDLYNVFLTMNFFHKTSKETHVLLVDAKPRSHLDPLWGNLFASVTQLSALPLISQYDTLVWNYFRSHSPILVQQTDLPLVSQFRQFLLNGHGLKADHFRNCREKALNILFVWRRNYVAHPRNPTGMVARKIKNEDELINTTKVAFPTFHITGVQLDKLHTRDQLKLISTADIMIGMHGAAFGFGFALPPGSGMIEMFPLGSGANWHMQYIAKWSGVFYMQYKNKKKRYEDVKAKYTYVLPQDVISLIHQMALKICPGMPLPKLMPLVSNSKEVVPLKGIKNIPTPRSNIMVTNKPTVNAIRTHTPEKIAPVYSITQKPFKIKNGPGPKLDPR